MCCLIYGSIFYIRSRTEKNKKNKEAHTYRKKRKKTFYMTICIYRRQCQEKKKKKTNAYTVDLSPAIVE